MNQIEQDRFAAFINHIAATPDLGDRVRLACGGLMQLFHERVLAATDVKHLEPFSDLVNMLDKNMGALEAAVINGSPAVATGAVELFPGDLGYQVPERPADVAKVVQPKGLPAVSFTPTPPAPKATRA